MRSLVSVSSILRVSCVFAFAAFGAATLHAQDTCAGKVQVVRVYNSPNMGGRYEYTVSLKNLTATPVAVDVQWDHFPSSWSQPRATKSWTIPARLNYEMPIGGGTDDVTRANIKLLTGPSLPSGPYISAIRCR